MNPGVVITIELHILKYGDTIIRIPELKIYASITNLNDTNIFHIISIKKQRRIIEKTSPNDIDLYPCVTYDIDIEDYIFVSFNDFINIFGEETTKKLVDEINTKINKTSKEEPPMLRTITFEL